MKKVRRRIFETSFLAALLMLFYLMMINTASGQSKQIYYSLDLAISYPQGLSTTFSDELDISSALEFELVDIEDEQQVESYASFLLNVPKDSNELKNTIPENIEISKHQRDGKLLAPLIKIPFENRNK